LYKPILLVNGSILNRRSMDWYENWLRMTFIYPYPVANIAKNTGAVVERISMGYHARRYRNS